MRNVFWMLGIAGVSLMVAAGSGLGARSGQDGGEGDFEIYVAPSVIVKSAPCPCVTIHTEVKYRVVTAVSATVDGAAVAVTGTFADSRGNLVVKLGFDEVAALVDAPSATVGLELVAGGEALAAAETVGVKE